MKNFKRAFSLILAVLVFAALPISVGAAEIDVTVPPFVMAGDMNGDLELKADDLVLLQKAVLGVPLEYNIKSADMNSDGRVNIKDLVVLKKELIKATEEPDDGYFPGNW